MPEVSRFFGIIIRMYVETGGAHHMPHFHAYYQDHINEKKPGTNAQRIALFATSREIRGNLTL